MKVYGPYLRKDGRKHVIVVNDDRTRRTVSYPKWLKEQELGVVLDRDSTVDHRDRDFTNDQLENLRVLPRGEHSSEDARRVESHVFICSWCGEEGRQSATAVDHNRKRGSAGPFCSRRCAGKYGSAIMERSVSGYGSITVINVATIIRNLI